MSQCLHDEIFFISVDKKKETSVITICSIVSTQSNISLMVSKDNIATPPNIQLNILYIIRSVKTN